MLSVLLPRHPPPAPAYEIFSFASPNYYTPPRILNFSPVDHLIFCCFRADLPPRILSFVFAFCRPSNKQPISNRSVYLIAFPSPLASCPTPRPPSCSRAYPKKPAPRGCVQRLLLIPASFFSGSPSSRASLLVFSMCFRLIAPVLISLYLPHPSLPAVLQAPIFRQFSLVFDAFFSLVFRRALESLRSCKSCTDPSFCFFWRPVCPLSHFSFLTLVNERRQASPRLLTASSLLPL